MRLQLTLTAGVENLDLLLIQEAERDKLVQLAEHLIAFRHRMLILNGTVTIFERQGFKIDRWAFNCSWSTRPAFQGSTSLLLHHKITIQKL